MQGLFPPLDSHVNPDRNAEWGETTALKVRRSAPDAELPDLSPRLFHGLRHTYASLALEARVPTKLLSKRLGRLHRHHRRPLSTRHEKP
jgi:integrase